jgi:hypothetical protein
MAGDAPAADASGNVYLQNGNGDLVPGSQRFGDSIVKPRFQNNAISVSGFFAPCNQMLLDRCDLDQGSSGAVLFDEFVIGGGKGRPALFDESRQNARIYPRSFPATCGRLHAWTTGLHRFPRPCAKVAGFGRAHPWCTDYLERSKQRDLVLGDGRRRSTEGVPVRERTV